MNNHKQTTFCKCCRALSPLIWSFPSRKQSLLCVNKNGKDDVRNRLKGRRRRRSKEKTLLDFNSNFIKRQLKEFQYLTAYNRIGWWWWWRRFRFNDVCLVSSRTQANQFTIPLFYISRQKKKIREEPNEDTKRKTKMWKRKLDKSDCDRMKKVKSVEENIQEKKTYRTIANSWDSSVQSIVFVGSTPFHSFWFQLYYISMIYSFRWKFSA